MTLAQRHDLDKGRGLAYLAGGKAIATSVAAFTSISQGDCCPHRW